MAKKYSEFTSASDLDILVGLFNSANIKISKADLITALGVITSAQATKLSGIETAADVTDSVNVGTSINGATAKTTPIDADTMPLIDSAASNVLKKVTWANIKATLKTYFDTIFMPKETAINAQTGLTYTLVIADTTKHVTMSNALANTLTVPPNSSVAFAIGTDIDVSSNLAGQTTIAAGAGVTIRSADSKLKLRVQYSGATLRKIATDEWMLFGDIDT